MKRSFFVLLYTVVASVAVITSMEFAQPHNAYFWPLLPMLFALYAWRDYIVSEIVYT